MEGRRTYDGERRTEMATLFFLLAQWTILLQNFLLWNSKRMKQTGLRMNMATLFQKFALACQKSTKRSLFFFVLCSLLDTPCSPYNFLPPQTQEKPLLASLLSDAEPLIVHDTYQNTPDETSHCAICLCIPDSYESQKKKKKRMPGSRNLGNNEAMYKAFTCTDVTLCTNWRYGQGNALQLQDNAESLSKHGCTG